MTTVLIVYLAVGFVLAGCVLGAAIFDTSSGRTVVRLGPVAALVLFWPFIFGAAAIYASRIAKDPYKIGDPRGRRR